MILVWQTRTNHQGNRIWIFFGLTILESLFLSMRALKKGLDTNSE